MLIVALRLILAVILPPQLVRRRENKQTKKQQHGGKKEKEKGKAFWVYDDGDRMGERRWVLFVGGGGMDEGWMRIWCG